MGVKSIKTFLAGAAISAITASAAFAAPPPFVFHYDQETLDSSQGIKRIYKRIGEEAEERCAGEEMSDACRRMTIAQTVENLDDKSLTDLHEKETAGEATVETPESVFTFNFTDQDLDTVGGTRRFYERLQTEIGVFCQWREVEEGVGECREMLLDMVVEGVDERGLDRRHEKEKRKGSVFIVDQ